MEGNKQKRQSSQTPGFVASIVGLGCFITNQLDRRSDVLNARAILQNQPQLSSQEAADLRTLETAIPPHHALEEFLTTPKGDDAARRVLKEKGMMMAQWKHPLATSALAVGGSYVLLRLVETVLSNTTTTQR